MNSLGLIISAIPNSTNMSYEVQQATLTALMAIMVVLAIAMIIIVLMQQGTSENVSAITGSSDSFYGRNKAKTHEDRMKKITLLFFSLVLITSVIYFIVSSVEVGQAIL